MPVTVTYINADAGSPVYEATDFRLAATAFGAPYSHRPGSVRSGVRYTDGDDLKITVSGYTSTVRQGQCVVDATNLWAGGYVVSVDQNTAVTHAGADASLSRIDLVVARVYDHDQDGQAQRTAKIEIVQGNTASSPVAPPTPVHSLVLAEVRVPPAGNALVVTDKRRFAAALGGVMPCRSNDRPLNAPAGQVCYETDTGRLVVANGSGWGTIFYPSQPWTNLTYRPNIRTAGGNAPLSYTREGNWITLRGSIERIDGDVFYGGPGDNTYHITTMPSDARPSYHSWHAVACQNNGGVNTMRARVQTSGQVEILAPSGTGPAWVSFDGIRFAVA